MPFLIQWTRRDNTKSGIVPVSGHAPHDHSPREFRSQERAEAACEELNRASRGYYYVVVPTGEDKRRLKRRETAK